MEQEIKDRQKLITDFLRVVQGMKIRDIVKLAVMYTPNDALKQMIAYQEKQNAGK